MRGSFFATQLARALWFCKVNHHTGHFGLGEFKAALVNCVVGHESGNASAYLKEDVSCTLQIASGEDRDLAGLQLSSAAAHLPFEAVGGTYYRERFCHRQAGPLRAGNMLKREDVVTAVRKAVAYLHR